MIFIGNRYDGRFYKMIRPQAIDASTGNSNVLYVQDVHGNWFVLTFNTHEELVETMKRLCCDGRVTCRADCEMYLTQQARTKQNDYHDRELSFNDDIEMEIER